MYSPVQPLQRTESEQSFGFQTQVNSLNPADIARRGQADLLCDEKGFQFAIPGCFSKAPQNGFFAWIDANWTGDNLLPLSMTRRILWLSRHSDIRQDNRMNSLAQKLKACFTSLWSEQETAAAAEATEVFQYAAYVEVAEHEAPAPSHGLPWSLDLLQQSLRCRGENITVAAPGSVLCAYAITSSVTEKFEKLEVEALLKLVCRQHAWIKHPRDRLAALAILAKRSRSIEILDSVLSAMSIDQVVTLAYDDAKCKAVALEQLGERAYQLPEHDAALKLLSWEDLKTVLGAEANCTDEEVWKIIKKWIELNELPKTQDLADFCYLEHLHPQIVMHEICAPSSRYSVLLNADEREDWLDYCLKNREEPPKSRNAHTRWEHKAPPKPIPMDIAAPPPPYTVPEADHRPPELVSLLGELGQGDPLEVADRIIELSAKFPLFVPEGVKEVYALESLAGRLLWRRDETQHNKLIQVVERCMQARANELKTQQLQALAAKALNEARAHFDTRYGYDDPVAIIECPNGLWAWKEYGAKLGSAQLGELKFDPRFMAILGGEPQLKSLQALCHEHSFLAPVIVSQCYKLQMPDPKAEERTGYWKLATYYRDCGARAALGDLVMVLNEDPEYPVPNWLADACGPSRGPNVDAAIEGKLIRHLRKLALDSAPWLQMIRPNLMQRVLSKQDRLDAKELWSCILHYVEQNPDQLQNLAPLVPWLELGKTYFNEQVGRQGAHPKALTSDQRMNIKIAFSEQKDSEAPAPLTKRWGELLTPSATCQRISLDLLPNGNGNYRIGFPDIPGLATGHRVGGAWFHIDGVKFALDWTVGKKNGFILEINKLTKGLVLTVNVAGQKVTANRRCELGFTVDAKTYQALASGDKKVEMHIVKAST